MGSRGWVPGRGPGHACAAAAALHGGRALDANPSEGATGGNRPVWVLVVPHSSPSPAGPSPVPRGHSATGALPDRASTPTPAFLPQCATPAAARATPPNPTRQIRGAIRTAPDARGDSQRCCSSSPARALPTIPTHTGPLLGLAAAAGRGNATHCNAKRTLGGLLRRHPWAGAGTYGEHGAGAASRHVMVSIRLDLRSQRKALTGTSGLSGESPLRSF